MKCSKVLTKLFAIWEEKEYFDLYNYSFRNISGIILLPKTSSLFYRRPFKKKKQGQWSIFGSPMPYFCFEFQSKDLFEHPCKHACSPGWNSTEISPVPLSMNFFVAFPCTHLRPYKCIFDLQTYSLLTSRSTFILPPLLLSGPPLPSPSIHSVMW